MPTELERILPLLLPRAIEWVEAQSALILETGEPLTAYQRRLADAVGVAHPDQVRMKVVDTLPLPEDVELRNVAVAAGLMGPGSIGVTYGYGIYVRDGYVTNRLVSHECRHVHQYEQAGSIEAFLPVYLQQIVTVGYHDAPFEIDARRHERDIA
ncbi:MAG: hypothetical protein QNJ00_04465 [Woeseiaceae bacterium]|nr:hypothetical protein [Woeseiaceae bacterium]